MVGRGEECVCVCGGGGGGEASPHSYILQKCVYHKIYHLSESSQLKPTKMQQCLFDRV